MIWNVPTAISRITVIVLICYYVTYVHVYQHNNRCILYITFLCYICVILESRYIHVLRVLKIVHFWSLTTIQ